MSRAIHWGHATGISLIHRVQAAIEDSTGRLRLVTWCQYTQRKCVFVNKIERLYVEIRIKLYLLTRRKENVLCTTNYPSTKLKIIV